MTSKRAYAEDAPIGASTIDRLLEACKPGHTLPQPFYNDRLLYDFDLRAIFHRHWLQACLEIEIPEPGDFLTMIVGTSPIVILRDEAGRIRAFFNTCRHRGAQICQEEKGSLRRLVCPYHQWTYDLGGKLVYAGRMQESFEPDRHGLVPVAAETVAGVVYVSLAPSPPDLAPFRSAIERLLAPHDLQNAKLAHTATLVEKANWKLVMENARECYHCPAKHRELVRSFPARGVDGDDAEREARRREFAARCEAEGLPSGPVSGAFWEASRFPLLGDAKSITMDGSPAVAKPLGRTGDGDVGSMRWAMQPNCFNHAVGDYVFFFQALPTAPEETVVTAKWVVNKDAVEGVDYDLAKLIEVWDKTNLQDRWLAENNQRGVNAASYIPGPYSELAEQGVLKFTNWYKNAAIQYQRER
ncbi:MAG: aromatic ring-hydroxylating dioxygenase subunit alpha [Proteobacteria bacterium]|nr:aromatic ring-hydroxylating dioxygenase subunit alpha [Pseudomonadota bacterium]MBI3499914.1 aromatic ring-hydroxylating dioxygenase subunit alpha [Pseudomonadota bacterium]